MPTVLRCGSCDLVTTGDPPAGGKVAVCPRCGKSMSPKPPDPLIGRTIGGCRLIQRVGMGAMAVVYEAERQSDKQTIAVKMLTGEASKDEENGRRFAREAELCKSINHPNVVAVYTHGCENKIHFMIMEFVDGATMEAVIDKQGAIPWRQVAHLILQIAQALDHIGKLGIIHRDIKPGNILLTKGGVAKLLDLGFAKRLADGDSDRMRAQSGELTMQGVSMGSPAYMPPEQVLDAKNADTTADVYSLGATFYHAVTGQTPFNGKTAYEIMEKVLRHPPPQAHKLYPGIPKAVGALIEWSMQKDPILRPASAADFIRELEVAMFAPDDSKRIRKLRNSQKGTMTTWMVAVGVVVVVLVLVAAVWLFTK
jgi:eukaryotic-like serine/threonine-protein kinase